MAGAGRTTPGRESVRLFFIIIGICCVILVLRGGVGGSSSSSTSSSSSSSLSTVDATISTTTLSAYNDQIQYVQVDQQPKIVNGLEMIRYAAYRHNERLTVLEWAQALAESPDRTKLAQDFNQLIQDLPYDAVYMETKGASATTAPTKPWEVAFLAATRLQAFAEANPDPNAFGEHFTKCLSPSSTSSSNIGRSSSQKVLVCGFSNLGGDAYLVSPLPPSEITTTGTSATATTKDGSKPPLLRHYSHLAAFARHAPAAQVAELWTTVGREYYQRLLSDRSEVWWLNTEGTGVAWLHVRLDRRPKYYHYASFAEET